jgi:uncharacterized OB-fold protein
VIDPRPVIAGSALQGARCAACRHPHALRVARCTHCRAAALEPASFGPDGTVWSTTTLHVASNGRRAPYTLAYVDLDDGPRVLAHVDAPVGVGARVRLAGKTEHGDPRVVAVAAAAASAGATSGGPAGRSAPARAASAAVGSGPAAVSPPARSAVAEARP